MKISIITATFNRTATLRRAILSVKEQSYTNIETVIIDGCSTDDSLDTIQDLVSISDIVLSEPDEGIYDALNKGINLSSGEIVGFLHSDDLYDNDEVVAQVADIFGDPSIDIVYGNVSFFEGSNRCKVKRIYISPQLSKSNLAWGKMPAHPALFCRKAVFDKVGLFQLDYKIAADYEFLCRPVNTLDFKAQYVNSIFVNMQEGGASRIGLRNTYILNKEVCRAVKSNGIYTNLLMILSKYPLKVLEFVR